MNTVQGSTIMDLLSNNISQANVQKSAGMFDINSQSADFSQILDFVNQAFDDLSSKIINNDQIQANAQIPVVANNDICDFSSLQKTAGSRLSAQTDFLFSQNITTTDLDNLQKELSKIADILQNNTLGNLILPDASITTGNNSSEALQSNVIIENKGVIKVNNTINDVPNDNISILDNSLMNSNDSPKLIDSKILNPKLLENIQQLLNLLDIANNNNNDNNTAFGEISNTANLISDKVIVDMPITPSLKSETAELVTEVKMPSPLGTSEVERTISSESNPLSDTNRAVVTEGKIQADNNIENTLKPEGKKQLFTNDASAKLINNIMQSLTVIAADISNISELGDVLNSSEIQIPERAELLNTLVEAKTILNDLSDDIRLPEQENEISNVEQIIAQIEAIISNIPSIKDGIGIAKNFENTEIGNAIENDVSEEIISNDIKKNIESDKARTIANNNNINNNIDKSQIVNPKDIAPTISNSSLGNSKQVDIVVNINDNNNNNNNKHINNKIVSNNDISKENPIQVDNLGKDNLIDTTNLINTTKETAPNPINVDNKQVFDNIPSLNKADNSDIISNLSYISSSINESNSANDIIEAEHSEEINNTTAQLVKPTEPKNIEGKILKVHTRILKEIVADLKSISKEINAKDLQVISTNAQSQQLGTMDLSSLKEIKAKLDGILPEIKKLAPQGFIIIDNHNSNDSNNHNLSSNLMNKFAADIADAPAPEPSAINDIARKIIIDYPVEAKQELPISEKQAIQSDGTKSIPKSGIDFSTKIDQNSETSEDKKLNSGMNLTSEKNNTNSNIEVNLSKLSQISSKIEKVINTITNQEKPEILFNKAAFSQSIDLQKSITENLPKQEIQIKPLADTKPTSEIMSELTQIAANVSSMNIMNQKPNNNNNVEISKTTDKTEAISSAGNTTGTNGVLPAMPNTNPHDAESQDNSKSRNAYDFLHSRNIGSMTENESGKVSNDSPNSFIKPYSIRINDIPRYVSRIVTNLQNNTTHTATLNLSPASLGKISIEISINGNLADLKFKVEGKDTAKSVESQMVQLKESLAKSGIKIESVGVEQNNINSSADKHAGHQQGYQGENSRFGKQRTHKEYLNMINFSNKIGKDDEMQGEESINSAAYLQFKKKSLEQYI